MKSNLCNRLFHVIPLAGLRFTLRRVKNNINAANAAIGRLIRTVENEADLKKCGKYTSRGVNTYMPISNSNVSIRRLCLKINMLIRG